MNTLRKIAIAAALGAVALGAGPAVAQNAIVQGWRYNNNPAWADQQPYLGENEGGYGYGAPGYYNGYANGYGPGYGPGMEVGGATIALCPGGYRLGPSGRECWPD